MKIKICNTNNRSFKQLSDYEEDKEARKVTGKCMEEIGRFKTKLKGIKN